jgi:hypothetical protein
MYDDGPLFRHHYLGGDRHRRLADQGRASHKQGWKKLVLTFRATSDRTTISFINGDPRTDNSNGLDAVSLT